MKQLSTQYLVVGAGAAGMAFVDALIGHSDARVVIVDRRFGPGGHWLDDYPFVRLHQASVFYGVSSTLLGGGRVQSSGPEEGLQERATAAEVVAYYAQCLDRLVATGQVRFLPCTDYLGDRTIRSAVTGELSEVGPDCRIVDAQYLSPHIPINTPPPFGVGDGARVIPVNDVVKVDDGPSQFVICGAGKTATDTIVWLLHNGLDPNRILWVRPRDPWMTNRAVVQPNPAIIYAMAADTMEAASLSETPDELFLRLEAAGIMLRIDRSRTPTMAKAPTLAQWELDDLRSVENVIRRGHLRGVASGKLSFPDGDVPINRDAVIVHCAAPGLQYPELKPIWQDRSITLQPVRVAFPLFGAALIGYVEAMRDNDIDKNRVCRPSPLPDTPATWARMQFIGTQSTQAFNAEDDLRHWANSVALNPARIPAELADDLDVLAAKDRLKASMPSGMQGLSRLAAG